ncbi:hypothetical protein ACFY12_28455 [Streptomyces sp. NPDC001339]|uniref:hypothetical protein n=1 Tax=Streptomyces sp. NPDC001339 TaxID=3364563 RepID=UPI003679EECE
MAPRRGATLSLVRLGYACSPWATAAWGRMGRRPMGRPVAARTAEATAAGEVTTPRPAYEAALAEPVRLAEDPLPDSI